MSEEIENGIDLLELAEAESKKHSLGDGKSLLNERYHFEKGFIKGYQAKEESVKRMFRFDYLGKPYVNEDGHRVAECNTAEIYAYDVEHAKLLFESKFPDESYDEPY